MTRRQKISSLIKGYLQAVLVTGGYLTNMGQKVTVWKSKTVAKNDTMSCDIMDEENVHQRGHSESLHFVFELTCKASDNYTTITNMIQDLQKALSTNEKALGTAIGSQARWIPGTEKIEIKQEGDSEIGEASVSMDLEHRWSEKWSLDTTVY